MFTDKEYKRKINLSEFRDINFNYLKRTKELQSVVESTLKDAESNGELNSLIRMIDNQFKKLAKVNRDDMKIYLWIVNSDSTFFKFKLDEKTRKAYYDKSSPVMHKVVKK